MDRDELLSTVQELGAEVLGTEASAIGAEAKFGDDLDADSLDLVELVMALEDRLGVTVPEEDLEGIVTVADAVDLLEAKLRAAA